MHDRDGPLLSLVSWVMEFDTFFLCFHSIEISSEKAEVEIAKPDAGTPEA